MIEKMMAEEAARRAEETTKAKKRGWSINLPNSTQTDLGIGFSYDFKIYMYLHIFTCTQFCMWGNPRFSVICV